MDGLVISIDYCIHKQLYNEEMNQLSHTIINSNWKNQQNIARIDTWRPKALLSRVQHHKYLILKHFQHVQRLMLKYSSLKTTRMTTAMKWNNEQCLNRIERHTRKLRDALKVFEWKMKFFENVIASMQYIWWLSFVNIFIEMLWYLCHGDLAIALRGYLQWTKTNRSFNVSWSSARE